MTALGQRMVSAVLVVAFASLYQWHGGKAALFLSIIAFLMFTGGLLLHWFRPRCIHIRRTIHTNRIEAGEQVRVLVELEFNCRIPLLWIVLCENTPAGVHRKLIFPEHGDNFPINMNVPVYAEESTDGIRADCTGVICLAGIPSLQRPKEVLP